MVKRLPPDDLPGNLPGVEHKVVPFKPNGRGSQRLRYEWEPLMTTTDWLVKNRFARRGVGALIGRGYTGKTQTLIDLCAAVTSNRDWSGEPVMRCGGVVFYSAEGGFGPMRSWHAVKELVTRPWYEHSGIVMPTEFPFALVTEMPTLLPKSADAVRWFSECNAEAQVVFKERFGCDLVLAVFDTLAKIAGFRDENSNAEITGAFKTLNDIAQASDLFVLTSDHLPKDENATRPRGGSAKYDSADSIMRIAVGEGDWRTLHVDKVRDNEGGQEIPFRLAVVDRGVDADGDKVTAVRIEWSVGSKPKAGRPNKSRPRLMLAIEQAFSDEHGEHKNIPSRGNRFVIPENWVRQNYFARSGGANETEESIKRTYRRALEKAKLSGEIDTHRFENGDVFVWVNHADTNGQLRTDD